MLYHKQILHDTSDEWVTFIHGAGGSSSIWYRQIKQFSEEYNVLLIDLRGHGYSKNINLKSLQKYTFRSISKEVIEVLEHLKIKSSHFIGISLGTIIIRELAEIIPQKMDSMIMAGAVLKMNFRSRILMKLGFWLKSIVPYILLYKLLAFIIMPKKNHRKSRSIFIREAKKLYQKEFIRWFEMTTSVNKILRFFRSKDPKIPTLYVMGSEDYMFLPPVRMTVQNHASAQLAVVEGSGHVVNIDKPDQFNDISLDFLKSIHPVAK